jgi:molybdopterin molybdotransferase
MTNDKTVEEALAAVIELARPMPAEAVPLESALRCVLAEDVAADMDLPPFDKSLVDGYAVRSEDLGGPERRLRIGETIVAGQVPSRPLGPREAAVIMTGAPVPSGCDAVVMLERTLPDGGDVWVEEPEVRAGQNILPRAREMRAGDRILGAGTVLKPAHLGVLASVGRTPVRVVRPRMAIVPTGDELVEPERTPGPGQIRNSNAIMLRALALEEGAAAESLPTAPDEPVELRRILERGLDFDVLIVTGGVSAGQRDLVPAALAELGVRRVFHKVRLKPGKPLWFGIGPARAGRPGTLVFGLPGNPVSSLVVFLLFVRPALAVLAGRVGPIPGTIEARLTCGFRHRGDRPTYHPARLTEGSGLGPGPDGSPRLAIETLTWHGSADLRTAAAADGFAAFAAGDRDYHPGEIVGFLPAR